MRRNNSGTGVLIQAYGLYLEIHNGIHTRLRTFDSAHPLTKQACSLPFLGMFGDKFGLAELLDSETHQYCETDHLDDVSGGRGRKPAALQVTKTKSCGNLSLYLNPFRE